MSADTPRPGGQVLMHMACCFWISSPSFTLSHLRSRHHPHRSQQPNINRLCRRQQSCSRTPSPTSRRTRTPRRTRRCRIPRRPPTSRRASWLMRRPRLPKVSTAQEVSDGRTFPPPVERIRAATGLESPFEGYQPLTKVARRWLHASRTRTNCQCLQAPLPCSMNLMRMRYICTHKLLLHMLMQENNGKLLTHAARMAAHTRYTPSLQGRLT